MITRSLVLVVLCLVPLSSAGEGKSGRVAATGPSPVSVESWSTSVTALQPEAHLLIENHGAEPVEFLLEFAPGGNFSCDPNNRGTSGALATTLSRRSRASLAATLGSVPPNGWTHRSFLAGLSGGGAPCRVPYRLTVREGKGNEWRSEAAIEARTNRPVETGSIDPSDLDIKRFVEEDRSTRLPTALLRLLVRNKGTAATSIGISEIRFECSGGERPRRDLHYATLQGEDVGPALLLPGSSNVFVIGIDVSPTRSLRECRGLAEVTAFEREGRRTLKSFEFDLVPEGYLDFGGHGFK